MPPSRSRLGCRTCKKRRVKVRAMTVIPRHQALGLTQTYLARQCDESRPWCQKCTLFRIPCDYSPADTHPSLVVPAPEGPASRPRGRGRPRRDWNAWATQTLISDATPSQSPDDNEMQLNVDDLELLRHYRTKAVATLGTDSLWSKGVPQLASRYPGILSLILALSAYHMARQTPEDLPRLHHLAEQHMADALPRAKLLLGDIDSTTAAPALYVTSVLICYTVFAQGPRPGNLLMVAEGEHVPWLSLLRGVRLVVLSLGWDHIFSGVLAPYAPKPGVAEDTKCDTPPRGLRTDGVEDWRSSLAHISELINTCDEDDLRSIYKQTLTVLLSSFEATFGQGYHAWEAPGTMQSIMSWLYQIRQPFITALAQMSPIALIILGHFCVLLRTLEGYWFIEGWAVHIMNEILHISKESRESLSWPCQYLGLIDHPCLKSTAGWNF